MYFIVDIDSPDFCLKVRKPFIRLCFRKWLTLRTVLFPHSFSHGISVFPPCSYLTSLKQILQVLFLCLINDWLKLPLIWSVRIRCFLVRLEEGVSDDSRLPEFPLSDTLQSNGLQSVLHPVSSCHFPPGLFLPMCSLLHWNCVPCLSGFFSKIYPKY